MFNWRKTTLMFLGSFYFIVAFYVIVAFYFIVAFVWITNLLFILPQPTIAHHFLILSILSIVFMFLACFFFAEASKKKQSEQK